jgi:hypothetical protein
LSNFHDDVVKNGLNIDLEILTVEEGDEIYDVLEPCLLLAGFEIHCGLFLLV